jgi:hypothetical protein
MEELPKHLQQLRAIPEWGWSRIISEDEMAEPEKNFSRSEEDL